MNRITDVDKVYRRFHGQKAIDRFFKTFPELAEWKDTFEWMCESGTDHYIDDMFADGTKNNDWCYSLWLEEEEDYTYIAIIERA